MSFDELVSLTRHGHVECSLKPVATNRDDQEKPRWMCEHDTKPSKSLWDLADNYSRDESIPRRDREYSACRERTDSDRCWTGEVSCRVEPSSIRRCQLDRGEKEPWRRRCRPTRPTVSWGISTMHWSIRSSCEVNDKRRKTRNWTVMPHDWADTDR